MVEQTHVTNYLADKLGRQIAEAQTAAQRNKMGKAVLNSEKLAEAMEHVNEERVHEKWQGVEHNPVIRDAVHISPKAEALYRAHESGRTQAPERAHERAQSQPPEVEPVEPEGPLGPMSPEI